MKRLFAIILCFAFALSCAACSSADTKIDDKEIENTDSPSDHPSSTDTKLCQHDFKEEIYKEPNYGVEGIKIKYCSICQETEYIPIPALSEVFEINVKNKTVSTQGNECFVVFDIEIKNTSDKKIESISGNLSIMPSDCILELVCEFDELSLDPHATTLISSHGYSFDSNESLDTVERKVYDAKFEDIKFYFTPTDVVVAE